MPTNMTALVTGANKGIGYETTRQLAERGYTVWLGSRDLDRGETAARTLATAGDVRPLQLDVTDQASVSAAAARVSEESGVLDALVNNAGVAVREGEGRPGTVNPDTVQRALEVNFYGALRVTQTFLPLVRRASASRIVNVSSTLGSLSTLMSPSDPFSSFDFFAYPASKTMLNALTAWFAVELRHTAIMVNAVCPGSNATDMVGNVGAQQPSQGARVVVRAATLNADGPRGTFFDASGPIAW
jgi:NAD(P)-dependent dehydrogenase (short-subunit alcohol dehydrogenase family)